MSGSHPDLPSFPTRRSSDLFEQVSWRQGTKGAMTSRFTAARVRPANRNLPRNRDGSLPECWLLIEWRSEEHTSELQSRGHLVCRLLLEKKKTSFNKN